MDEHIICDICTEVYDGGYRCPRVFVCGHSFCSACVHKLLKTCSFCPACKTPIEKEKMESVAINYDLMKIVEKYSNKNTNEHSWSKVKKADECKTQQQMKLSSSGSCEVHKVPQHFRCMTCSIWICGNCAQISHKLCKILLVKEAIEEMKFEKNFKIRKNLATISEGETDSLSLRDHNRDILKIKNEDLQFHQQRVIALTEEIWEVNRNIEKVSGFQTDFTSVKERLECQITATNSATTAYDLEEIETNLTAHYMFLQKIVENLKSYKSSMVRIPENEIEELFHSKEKLMSLVATGGRILITANEDCNKRYFELDAKEGILRIHSMQEEPFPYSAFCITLDNYLTTMTGRKEWPQKMFLQFSSDELPLRDVIIILNKSSRQATKYVLHSCLFGIRRTSFQEIRMGHLDFGGEFICTETPSVASDVGYEAFRREKKKMKFKEGEIGLNVLNGNNELEFHVCICVNGSTEKWDLIPIGQVEKGLEVIKDAAQKIAKGERVEIAKCGWILN